MKRVKVITSIVYAIPILCICLCFFACKPNIIKSEQKNIHGKIFNFIEYEDGYKGLLLNDKDIIYGKYKSIG